MEKSIFKFSNINIARFVVEELNKRGHEAKVLSSGFISIQSILDESAAKLIDEQRGAVVVAGPSVTPVLSKFAGAGSMVDRRKLPSSAKKPKSPPTANPKKMKLAKTSANQKEVEEEAEKTSPESLKNLALESLKKMVEKYPNRFPKLAKIFGIKAEK